MNISGSGHIPAGDYQNEIRVSGSAKIDGTVRCEGLHCSGSLSGDGALYCRQDIRASGAIKISREVEAANIAVSGALKSGGGCTAAGEIRASGAIACEGDMKCSVLRAGGAVRVGGGIEAEEAYITGYIDCGGLLNAETVDIRLEGRGGNRVGSIGGATIKVSTTGKKNSHVFRMPLLSRLIGKSDDGLQVVESIEGDVIAVENVCAPLITGRIVAIGAGCVVERVQYSEAVEIHPDAKVDACEKAE